MTSCSSSSSAKLGEGARCSCFPYPSCILFPRRADGSVVLPNPLDLMKEGLCKRQREGNNEYWMTNGLAGSKGAAPCNCQGCFDAAAEKALGLVASSSSEPPHLVQSYAQLSSLPEFKAFRLNHEGELEDRGAKTNPAANRKSQKLEWMQEINVARRKKKQAYVRSGTHDFCIRLYSMGQKNNP